MMMQAADDGNTSAAAGSLTPLGPGEDDERRSPRTNIDRSGEKLPIAAA